MNTYTIKEVSEIFNIPASTLRYYENVGILGDIARTPNGQRIYKECDINRLGTICCFKNTGMSIANLQTFFHYEENGLDNIDDMIDLLTNQKDDVESQLIQLQSALENVKRKLDYYSHIKSALNSKQPVLSWDDYWKTHL